METITLDELLVHYRNRCQDILDELEKLQVRYNESLRLLHESWGGPNSEMMEEKLLEAGQKFHRGQEEIDMVHIILSNLLKGM